MTLGFGLIGASQMAQGQMIPAMRALGAQAVSVYSRTAAHAHQYAADNSIAQATTSLEDLLANPEVGAVYISSTNELHHDQVLAAAQAGKPILCEKPLALNLAQAQAMLDACQQAGVVLATNHHLRNLPVQRQMRTLIQQGAIGDPLAARVNQAVYLRESLQGWRLHQPDAGAGVVMDIAVHGIDSLRFILQAEPLEITSLSQYSGLASQTVEDGSMAIMRFDNQVLAQVHTAFTLPYAQTGLEIHGTAGSVSSQQALQRSAGSVLLRDEKGKQVFEFSYENPYQYGIKAFIEAVQGQGRPAADGWDGLSSLKTALACLQSARSKKTITL